MKTNRAPRFRDKTHKSVSNRQILSDTPHAATLVELVSPHSLRPSARNARTHSKKQIRQVANSIRDFGFINPIIADEQGVVVCGHARAEAAKLLELKRVPVIRITHLSEPEIRAYMLADNKLAEKAGWDREILAIELEELQLELPTLDLDLSSTGFETSEIDAIFSDLREGPRNNPADLIPELEETAVTRKGDLLVLGHHRIVVGDARDPSIYSRLMQSKKATMAFLDPPYNVKIDGHVGGRGRTKHREFVHASGEMTSKQYEEFLHASLEQCANHTCNGGITYVCMDWRHAKEVIAAGTTVFEELKNICVWAKTTPGQGTFYRSQHEFIFVFKTGNAPHINTFELGQHGRTRSNVWTYPGVNTFRPGRMDELRMHPTVKPVSLIVDAMKDCSKRGTIVLDAFAGSGSTIIAAEQVSRRAFCIEIDPRYVDTCIRRWQRMTGKDAIMESTGQTFDDLAEERRSHV